MREWTTLTQTDPLSCSPQLNPSMIRPLTAPSAQDSCVTMCAACMQYRYCTVLYYTVLQSQRLLECRLRWMLIIASVKVYLPVPDTCGR